ncbi:roadblock/LC7 domain-containing protein [Nocardia sp. NPDC004860]|uniref:roadblock/LC7 domain-containing protein n=1 Tax=unclassified Nocardia TaxID=2637762 RepID=UPI0033A97AC0
MTLTHDATALTGPGSGARIDSPRADSAGSDLETHLHTLRRRVPHLIGSAVASSDGLLLADDLPDAIEATGIAALTAALLSVSLTFAAATHGADLHEVVLDSGVGHVVVYRAGPIACLALLTGPDATLARVHLEARPVVRAIAATLAPAPHD